MVLVVGDHHHYGPSDLTCMNLLRHPIWIFDIDRRGMHWANRSALDLWNASTLDELVHRDFDAVMSEASSNFLQNVQNNQLARNEYVTDQWVVYPKDRDPIWIRATGSAVRIEGGRIAFLVETELMESYPIVSDNVLRTVEILKHLPVAVSQFTMDGTTLLYENPKASQWFGTSTTALSDTVSPTAVKVNSTSTTNILLQRFVNVEVGKKALMLVQQDGVFSAESEQYIVPQSAITTTTTTTTEAPRQQKKQRPVEVSPRWFNVMLRRARDPVTAEYMIICTAKDISEIVKARTDTKRASIKSEFLDVIAHEIRTPLHQIVGHVDLLDDTCTTTSKNDIKKNTLNVEQLESVVQIQSSCSMLISIINDLLDSSKIENGHLLREDVIFDMSTLIQECVDAIRPQTQMKGLQMTLYIDPQCTRHKVISDANRLRQIVRNVLSNASKFTHDGSIAVSVQPSTTNNDANHTKESLMFLESPASADPSKVTFENQHQQWLRFAVSDTGIGIDAQEQCLVFERYRQANASVARQFGGTGLGLSICKGLVELLGGTIGLQSEAGKGTTVYFDIPVILADSNTVDDVQHVSTECVSYPCTQPSLSTVLPHTMQIEKAVTLVPCGITTCVAPITGGTLLPECQVPIGLDILVVEDNIVNQKLLKSMLQRLGHGVTIAENGRAAILLIRKTNFHLVLMDVQMPVMDGIECTKHIRTVLQLSKGQLPIVGLTAGYQPSEREYYENDVGMNSCYGKPLPMLNLKQVIEKYYCRTYHAYQLTPVPSTVHCEMCL
jgi:signal transduction histidine kinase/CheY-like chemotaxis protein